MAKILLIDADQASSRKIMSMLADNGHTIIPARSAEDAWSILRSDTTIQLIMTDQTLPDADGLKLVKQISEVPQLKNIPVLLFLARADETILRDGMKAGVKGFLVKPCDPQTLLDKIQKALPNRTPTVLLIEDEGIVRDRLKYIIELKSFNVLVAMTAKQGLELLGSKRIDIIITDIGLPEMPATELIRIIKVEHPRMPILMITGLSGKLSHDVARAAGADSDICKPFRNVEIIEQLQELIHSGGLPVKMA